MNNHPFSSYPSQNLPAEQAHPEAQPGYAYPETIYPQQPAQPEYQPPRKKHIGLWATLLIVVLVLGGCGVYYYFQTRSTPQKTLQAYCDSLEKNNAQELYDTLSPKTQALTSVSKVQTVLRLLDLATNGGLKTCTFSNVQVNGSTATGSVTMTSDNDHTGSNTLNLVEQNNQWSIEDSSSLP